MTKQNFNLKLELHHRRERQSALEAKLEAAERQIEEQQELQDVNEQLLAELEKRDQAVEEAVGIIVALEERVEMLMRDREVVRNFDTKYNSDYFGHNHEELPSSPPTFHQHPRLASSKTMVRMPSFLSEQSEGTEALRSLYLPNNASFSDAALPKLLEEGSDAMNSPRLSALSVSSFVSIYGNKPLDLDSQNEGDEEDELPQPRHRKSLSVEKWIEQRPPTSVPTAIWNDRKNQYLSINDVMESPLQRLEKLKLTLEKNTKNTIASHVQLQRSNSSKSTQKPPTSIRRVITNAPSFDRAQTLPPTPDTISTSTLRHFQSNSNDTLAQSAHVNDSTFRYSSTFHTPTTATFHPFSAAAIAQSIHGRPRSAGETITSRRDGHGWDTDTQATSASPTPADEDDDDASVSSTFSASPFTNPSHSHYNGDSSAHSHGHSHAHPSHIPPPNLFSFNDFSHGHELGKEVEFDPDRDIGTDNTPLYTHDRTTRYAALRRASASTTTPPATGKSIAMATPGSHARSDVTITPRRYGYGEGHGGPSGLYGSSPIDDSPKPDPPDRRSSLSAAARLKGKREGRESFGHSTGSGKGRSSSGRRSSARGNGSRGYGTSELLPQSQNQRNITQSNNSTTNPAPIQQSNVGAGTMQQPRKTRLASLFKRADTAPLPSQPQKKENDSPAMDHSTNLILARSQTSPDEDERATPPPIKRSRDGPSATTSYPTSQSQLPVAKFRPSSAGAGVSTNAKPGSSAGVASGIRRGSAVFGSFGAGFGFGGGDGAGAGSMSRENKRRSVDSAVVGSFVRDSGGKEVESGFVDGGGEDGNGGVGGDGGEGEGDGQGEMQGQGVGAAKRKWLTFGRIAGGGKK